MTTDRERIVVGVDGSPASRDALVWAARQAELAGATLEVVMTWQWPVLGILMTWPEGFNPERDARDELEELVANVLGADPGIRVDIRVIRADPVGGLVETARGASLLVVGTRGHGPFSGMMVGSVSQHCINQASCSVVVVHRDVPTEENDRTDAA